MFLIFKPPQSYLQVQLLDPDGFKKHSSALEEAYAIKILQERQAKQQEKRKQLSFKKKIKKQLEAGKTTVEIATELSNEIIAEEPKFEFTEEMRADVARVMAEYRRQVQLETQAIVIEFASKLQQAKDVFQQEYQRKLEQKRKQKIKAKKIRVLFLLSTMDD
jgi:hypothetical protein